MGIIRMGPPEELVLLLKDTLQLSTFVETGTYKGSTAVWAAKHFEKVITIENSNYFFEKASTAFKDIENIQFVFGDSSLELRIITQCIDGAALFWLDAHWCGAESFGVDEQCPILDELKVILSSSKDNCILIDDARLFLSPPPLPHKIEEWPSIDLIFNTIHSFNASYYIIVFEDVILAIPDRIRSLVAQYCQSQITKAWNIHVTNKSDSGLRLVVKGIKLIFLKLLRQFKFAKKTDLVY